jgi:hypothetical protein
MEQVEKGTVGGAAPEHAAKADRPSLLTRIRVWCGVGMFAFLGCLVLLEKANYPLDLVNWLEGLLGTPAVVLGSVWLLLCSWQGLLALMRKGFWGAFCTSTFQRWLHFCGFGLLMAAPIAPYLHFLHTLLPRTSRVADLEGMYPVSGRFIMAVMTGSVVADWFLPFCVLLAVVVMLLEWRLPVRFRVRIRLAWMAVLILVSWGFCIWLLFESGQFMFKTIDGLYGRCIGYRYVLLDISLLGQADARHEASMRRLAEIRAGRRGGSGVPVAVASPDELSDSDCRHQVMFLQVMIKTGSDPLVRSRAAATLISLHERLERDPYNPYIASEVLELLREATGEEFESLAESAEWLEKRKDDPAWMPMKLHRFEE